MRWIFHRRVGRFVLPAVWPQMIAAEDQAFMRKTDFFGDLQDKIAEIAGFMPV
jgi:hypothetical protein